MIIQREFDLQDMSNVRAVRLRELTASIKDAAEKKENFKVALWLLAVRDERLYLEGGYKDIYDYGKRVLSYERANVNNYLGIAKKFTNPETCRSIFAKGQRDMTFTQLIELGRIGKVEDAVQLFESGAISYDTSSRAIREAVTAYKARKEQDKADEERAAREPLERAYEAFHAAYNELKAHLHEIGDTEGADVLLPRIMDNVVIIWAEKPL